MHPLVLGLHLVHGLLDRLRDHDAAERQIARRDALGEGDDVGQHVPVLEREPLAGPAEAGDDLVGDEEHVVLVADLPHQREVVVGRVEHAAPAVDRLGDEGGHRVRTLAHDGLFQEARGGLPRGLSRLGALLTVRITSWNMHEARHAGLEHLPVGRHAGRAHRLQRHAVIGERARDDLHLVGLALGLPVEPRGLERGLVGLRAPRGEEDPLHVRVRDGHQLGRELDGRDVGRAGIGGVVGELADLVGRRVRQLGPAVAHVDVPQPGEPVDVLAALHVGQHRAAAAHVDHRLQMVARVVQRVDQVILVVLDELCGLDGHRTPPTGSAGGRWTSRARGPGSRRPVSARRGRAGRCTSRCTRPDRGRPRSGR